MAEHIIGNDQLCGNCGSPRARHLNVSGFLYCPPTFKPNTADQHDETGREIVSGIDQYGGEEEVRATIQMLWRSRCGDGTIHHLRYIQATIDTLCAVGRLTGEQAELWHLRILKCPGHEPACVWCAYCGDIPRDSNPFEDEPVQSPAQAPSQLYYLQDRRSYVGNSMVWWGKNRTGYVCNIHDAHLFTEEEFKAHARVTDIPWRKEYIESHVSHHIDMQHVFREDGTYQPADLAVSRMGEP